MEVSSNGWMNLHPGIRKFWEKYGVINCIDEPTSHVTNTPYYYISKRDGSTETIAAPFDDNKLAYYFDGRWYYEEDVLRLIKLSAFI